MDVDGEIVYVPQAQVTANLEGKPDGSYYFLLAGGPLHGHRIRVYPPFTRIVFPSLQDGGTPITYEIHPPMDKTGKWCYVHNPKDTTPPTLDERRPSGRWGRTREPAEVDAAWRTHERYKYADQRRIGAIVAARKPKQTELIGEEVGTTDETD